MLAMDLFPLRVHASIGGRRRSGRTAGARAAEGARADAAAGASAPRRHNTVFTPHCQTFTTLCPKLTLLCQKLTPRCQTFTPYCQTFTPYCQTFSNLCQELSSCRQPPSSPCQPPSPRPPIRPAGLTGLPSSRHLAASQPMASQPVFASFSRPGMWRESFSARTSSRRSKSRKESEISFFLSRW